MNLHWQIIIAPSPLFILGFTFGVSRSVCLDKCIMTCLHYSIIQNIFTDLKILHRTPVHLSPLLRQPRIFYCLFSFACFYNVIVWNIQCVAFSDWLLSLSNMHVCFFHIFSWLDSSLLFLALNNIPLSGWSVYLSIYLLRTFESLPHCGSYEQDCYKHPVAGFCVDVSFHILWVNTQGHNYWIIWQEHVWFCKKLPNRLQKCLYQLAFPPAMNESSCCSTFLSASGGVSVQDFCPSNGSRVLSHCLFNLHFPEGVWCIHLLF